MSQIEQHQLASGHAQCPQRRQLSEPTLALGQQADEQRHSRDPQCQAIERGSGGEGAFEDLCGPALEPTLIDDATVFQGKARLKFAHQRRHRHRGDAQIEAIGRQLRPIAQQVLSVDQQMALGIAVVGVDRDDARRPLTLWCGNRQLIADLNLEPACQLLAEHQGVVPGQLIPGIVRLSVQQRPVLTVGRVVDHADCIHRPAL